MNINNIYDKKQNLFVSVFTSILLVASIFSIFYHFILHGYYLDSPWPQNSFFYLPDFIGNDFTRMIEVSANLDSYGDMRKIFPGEANPYGTFSYIYFYFLSVLSFLYKKVRSKLYSVPFKNLLSTNETI